MLKRFRASNFKSHLNLEFSPTGLNLLLGKNNAGKTNLCSALRFVGETSRSSFDAAAKLVLGETWNITNIHVDDRSLGIEIEVLLPFEGEELDYQYELRLSAEPINSGGMTQSLKVVEEKLMVTGNRFQQAVLLHSKKEPHVLPGRLQARLLNEERFLEGEQAETFVRTLAPVDSTMLSQLYELETNRRACLFRRYLQAWRYYNLSPYELRSTAVIPGPVEIAHGGGNLSKVIASLHNERPRMERKLIEIVRKLEPNLDLFSFATPTPEYVHLFLEDEKGKQFSTQSMSDGTLRFLAMAYLILNAAELPDPSAPKPLIIIEEPENGLYVGHLKSLLERIDKTGRNGQFIFTTHSPYFIDLFDNHLEGVNLIKPGKPSSILIKPDAERLTKLLEEMPLGELHFRELIT